MPKISHENDITCGICEKIVYKHSETIECVKD